MSETYTVKQVADILGFSTNSIYTFLKQGRLKGIRVGKGRFRITEEELGRVLHLSKKGQIQESAEPSLSGQLINGKEIKETANQSYIVSELPKAHIDVASVFDWFIAIASIASGFSLLLFNQYFARLNSAGFLYWMLPMQVSFVAGGAGLIITDLYRNSLSKIWHRVFHYILTGTYLAFAFSRYQIGEFGTGFIFGLAGVCLILNLIFQIRGIEMLLFFISIFSVGSAITLLNRVSAPWIIENIIELNPYSTILLIVLALVFSVLAWWTRNKKRRAFWLTMMLYGAVFTLLSFWFAGNLSWTKAFFVLILGLTALLTPVWDTLSVQKRLEKRIIPPIFLGILLITVITASVIWLMEQNMKEFVDRELKNKLEYGQLLLDSNLEAVEKSITDATQSRILLEAMAADDKELIREVLRLVIDGNANIRLALALNKNGDLLNVYPHTILTEDNFYNRDYFRQASEGKVYTSNLFDTKTPDKRKALVVSTPIHSPENNEIMGVLVFSLNLDSLSSRLQKVANPENGEYFILIDKRNRIIASPLKNQIGKLNDLYTESVSYKENKELYEFESNIIIDKTGWELKIRSPLREILKPTKTVSILIFGSISILMFLISAYLFLVKKIHVISL
ncbi:hypothetical protein A2963_04615 [Candidatus Roizmanbacteria bacterium RIFCSPLOWO2_01_FULL_40_13]|nr:MAG: hypothetical protein A2963_04615 [Candidatus Roizmanbacteria bacterium RIFCSPLOWO2_01_FULL_40_13]